MFFGQVHFSSTAGAHSDCRLTRIRQRLRRSCAPVWGGSGGGGDRGVRACKSVAEDFSMNCLFDKHAALLDGARRAIRARTYWSAYPESPSPKVYRDAAEPVPVIGRMKVPDAAGFGVRLNPDCALHRPYQH
jgi:hypothetical protein